MPGNDVAGLVFLLRVDAQPADARFLPWQVRSNEEGSTGPRRRSRPPQLWGLSYRDDAAEGQWANSYSINKLRWVIVRARKSPGDWHGSGTCAGVSVVRSLGSLFGWDDSMRSIGMLAVITGMLVLASACGDGTSTPPPENTEPVAKFDIPPCTINVDCTFVSTSTDDAQVTEWSWDFDGDGDPDANTARALFMYTTAGDFNVSLTVWDAQGLSHTKTSTLTIAPVPPVNSPPTAGFTHTCTAADCTFTSTSTDVAPGTIATYAWTFGDGATAEVNNPSHGYTVTATTDFTVTLTVTDNEGATDVATQTVTIHPAPPANAPPTASFNPWCYGEACIFYSTSTDAAPGTIASYAWTFGDGATEDWAEPSHVYIVSARTTFTVTLTVRDNEGATAVATQTVTVSPLPPAVQGCTTSSTRPTTTTSGQIVECVLDIAARSTLKLKLLGIDCDRRRITGSRVVTPPPVADPVFLSVCSKTVGEELGIFGGRLDELIVFEAGTQTRIWFRQGAPRPNVVLGPPAGQLTGTFPDWTMNFEDGAHPGAAGEPDFTDVVVGVHATVVP